jgi:sugar phosphate isomerase/epimerase
MMSSEPSSSALSRRTFLQRVAATTAVVVGGGRMLSVPAAAAAAAPATPDATTKAPPRVSRSAVAFPFCGLEKHFFEKYTPEQTAQTFAEIGMDIELTVRPDGHIKPANAAEELPAMAAAFARHQRRILIVASSFVRPDEPHIESTLRAAKQLGISCYRHRGFRYRAGVPLKEQIASFRSQAREFAAMNQAIGIQALYQNHAGADQAGAAIWDLDQILDDIEPKWFGVALDARHLMVEQGRAWPTAVRLIAPRVGSLFVKSFRWERERTIETPLRDGIVTDAVVNAVVADRPSLPVCIHIEHTRLQPVPFAERAGIVGLFRDDAAILRQWLGIV